MCHGIYLALRVELHSSSEAFLLNQESSPQILSLKPIKVTSSILATSSQGKAWCMLQSAFFTCTVSLCILHRTTGQCCYYHHSCFLDDKTRAKRSWTGNTESVVFSLLMWLHWWGPFTLIPDDRSPEAQVWGLQLYRCFPPPHSLQAHWWQWLWPSLPSILVVPSHITASPWTLFQATVPSGKRVMMALLLVTSSNFTIATFPHLGRLFPVQVFGMHPRRGSIKALAQVRITLYIKLG